MSQSAGLNRLGSGLGSYCINSSISVYDRHQRTTSTLFIMDSLTDEIESVAFVAREVMGELLLQLVQPVRLAANGQCTRCHHARRRRDTRQPNGTWRSSCGRDGCV